MKHGPIQVTRKRLLSLLLALLLLGAAWPGAASATADAPESPAADGPGEVLRFEGDTRPGREDDLHVTAETRLGSLPAGAVMRVEAEADGAMLEALTAEYETEERHVSLVQALTIRFYDAEGRETEPLYPVRVLLRSEAAAKAEFLELVELRTGIAPEGAKRAAPRVEPVPVEDADIQRVSVADETTPGASPRPTDGAGPDEEPEPEPLPDLDARPAPQPSDESDADPTTDAPDTDTTSDKSDTDSSSDDPAGEGLAPPVDDPNPAVEPEPTDKPEPSPDSVGAIHESPAEANDDPRPTVADGAGGASPSPAADLFADTGSTDPDAEPAPDPLPGLDARPAPMPDPDPEPGPAPSPDPTPAPAPEPAVPVPSPAPAEPGIGGAVEVAFTLSGSGAAYALVGTETIVYEYLSAEGEHYVFTISYNAARFPFLSDAALEVRELEGEELERYLAATEAALAEAEEEADDAPDGPTPDDPVRGEPSVGFADSSLLRKGATGGASPSPTVKNSPDSEPTDPVEEPAPADGDEIPDADGEPADGEPSDGEPESRLAFARFFDVRLTAPDGTEYHELGGDVRVTVTLDEPLLDAADGALYAVHFPDGPDAAPELSDAELSEDGTELTFTQSGFSATGTVLEGEFGDGGSGSRWWPEVWGNNYVIDEDWLPYVVLVREPESGNPDPDRPYYMLEVDTDSAYEETVGGYSYTRFKVKLVEADVREEADGSLSLNFTDDPLTGVTYDSFEDIDQWIWYHHRSGSGNNAKNNLKNAATGLLLGPAVGANPNRRYITSNSQYRPQAGEEDTWFAEYCAGAETGPDGTSRTDAYNLDFSAGSNDARYIRRLFSQNKMITSPFVWYFMKDGNNLKGVTNGQTQSAANNVSNLLDRYAPPDANAPLYQAGHELADQPLAPHGVLEFYFATELRINGQEILTPATFPYDPTAVNANNPAAEDPYGDKNPYSFHTYADNPDLDARLASITPDPPAAEKTLDPNGDGSYTLSLSVTANAGANAMPDESAEVVLVVDVSNSMNNPTTNPAIEQEKAALLQIGEMLKEKHVPFHVILFSTGAWTDGKTYTEDNYGEFAAMVSGLTTRLGGSTCWEAALHLAGRVLKQIDDAEDGSTVNYKDKYVMFISDGKPNRHVWDTRVENPYQITEFSQSFDGTIVSGWGYAEGQSSGGTSGAVIEMRPLLLEQKLVAAGANVINVFIQSNETDGTGPKWMKRMSNIAYAGGIYTQEPPAGTYYWADAANDGEIAGELIAATRFMLRKYLYQDVRLTDGLTEGTALAGVDGLAPAGGQPDFSYKITLKDGPEYVGEIPAGETALRFYRDADGERRYLAGVNPETGAAETEDPDDALLLQSADYDPATRKVNWDVKTADGQSYTLIEDAAYTVSFPVWPNQESYDDVTGGTVSAALTDCLSRQEGYGYTYLRSDPPTSLSRLFTLPALAALDPGDVAAVTADDPSVTVTHTAGDWTLSGLNPDRPTVLTVTMTDGSVIVVRAEGVAGPDRYPLQKYSYTFPLDAPPPTLSSLFSLLGLADADVAEAVSSDPEGMLLTRAAPTWTLKLSEGCDHALWMLTLRSGQMLAVYASGDATATEESLVTGLPAAAEEYVCSFSFRQPPSSLSGLLDLLEAENLLGHPDPAGVRTDVARIESGNPQQFTVTHAAPGDWRLEVSPDLRHGAVLAITRKDGTVIAVEVPYCIDKLESGNFPLQKFDYTYPRSEPPAAMSELFALPNLAALRLADVASVVSGDPAGISVAAAAGDWTLTADPALDRAVPLTVVMNDGSVLVVFATPSDESDAGKTLETLPTAWGLATNRAGTAVGYKPTLVTQEDDNPPEFRDFPDRTDPIDNPPPVLLASWRVGIKKEWIARPTEYADIDTITLTMTNNETGEAVDVLLTRSGEWLSAEVPVSAGLMVKLDGDNALWGQHVTWNGQPYVLLNPGHSYTFTEADTASAYQFELDAPVLWPVLVDGKERFATREGNAYTDAGAAQATFRVKNLRKGAISVSVVKRVLDAEGQVARDDGGSYSLSVALTAPGGDASGFRALTAGVYVADFLIHDAEGNDVTEARYPNAADRYLVFDANGAAAGTFTLGAGERVVFPDVPEDTLFSAAEPDVPEGCTLQGIEYSVTVDGVHPARNHQTNEAVVVNRLGGGPQGPTHPLRIITTDSYLNPLRMAVLELEQLDGAFREDFTTWQPDAAHTIPEVPDGLYRLTERLQPEGWYLLLTTVYFRFDAGVLTFTDENGVPLTDDEGHPIEAPDPYRKTDETGGDPVTPATILIPHHRYRNFLPSAGGEGATRLSWIGFALLCLSAAALLVLRWRSRKK